MSKIKVFLGAYINQTNAQNLNCLELARHLDKSKYEVYTLSIAHGNLGKPIISGVHVFNCWYPVKLSSYLGFFWGIIKCDVAYLPRGNNSKYLKWLLGFFKRRTFKQVERVVDKDKPEEFSQLFENLNEIRDNYFYTTKTYAISRFIRDYSKTHLEFPMQPEVLPVPVNVQSFRQITSVKRNLKNVILIGNELVRKGISDYFLLVKKFPMLHFHVIGRDDKRLVKEFKNSNGVENLTHHGLLSFDEMALVLKNIDLHLLLSKSEGFGKVTIECAAAGIPSIVYNTYGAEEWIEHGVNGFVVSSVSDVEEIMTQLLEYSHLLSKLSENCRSMPERYLPEVVVKHYERVIDELMLKL